MSLVTVNEEQNDSRSKMHNIVHAHTMLQRRREKNRIRSKMCSHTPVGSVWSFLFDIIVFEHLTEIFWISGSQPMGREQGSTGP
jgi:hypothetical protein